MFLISAKDSTIEILKKLFRTKDVSFYEKELAGNRYLICFVDPLKIIPHDLLRKIRINRISTHDAKKLIQAEMKEKKEKVEGKMQEGVRVYIKDGPYKEMKGVVSRVLKDNRVEIIISVFGQPVPVTIERDKLLILSEKENRSKKEDSFHQPD